jgi:nitrate/TMAO reductase-like tetraheme cytochrome c subunit
MRFLILGGSLACLLILLIVSAELTSTSRFCSTCHYMKTFYQSWKTSSHSNIACSTCHYPPGIKNFFRAKMEGLMQLGRYWSKLYLKSKPWAEIPDESCLRPGCHEKRLLQGQVKFKKIIFDHKVHLTDLRRGKRLRCTSCHSQIVQGEHISVTESTCFICHFKESKTYPAISQCTHCHPREELTPPSQARCDHTVVFANGCDCDKCHRRTIVGDGAVPRENCYKCHFERERLEKYNDTDLIHLNHIWLHKIECNQCHLQIQHKIVRDIETLADCRTCHTGTHQAQKILYTGEGGRGVAHPQPNIMLEKGLSCKGCHMFHEETGGQNVKSGTYVSREQACESCHGKGFGRILKGWETSTAQKLTEIKAVLGKARAEIDRSKGAQKAKAAALLQDAAFNIDVIERGKSVHNVTYSQELIAVSFSGIEDALLLIGSSYKPEKLAISTVAVPNQCTLCHAGIEEISGQVFGLRFSHEPHLVIQKLACSTCHSNVKRHGEFVAAKESCAPCHHKEPKQDCGRCHEIQKTIYQGGTLGVLGLVKSVMSEAEIDCTGCHRDARHTIVRSDGKTCAGCHEPNYATMFGEWQSTIATLVKSIRASIEGLKKQNPAQEQKNVLLQIESGLQTIEIDGSLGVHNYGALEEALTSYKKMIDSMAKSPGHD